MNAAWNERSKFRRICGGASHFTGDSVFQNTQNARTVAWHDINIQLPITEETLSASDLFAGGFGDLDRNVFPTVMYRMTLIFTLKTLQNYTFS